ncbi:MAG TPA: hypothetical protein VJ761_01620 [Ktedonobacteraceae bacterium]|nr:hypothetical protein [Ktedonobacteraceae bacterium]
MRKPLKAVLPIAVLVSTLLAFWFQTGLTEAATQPNSTWCIVSSPNKGAHSNFLYNVAVVSSSDIWAVGSYINGLGHQEALIEHSNGINWSIVHSANIETNGSELYGVTAVSSNDVWAVGRYLNVGQGYQTLIEHWNGKKWRLVSSPNPPHSPESEFSAVAAVSSNDIWAVGTYVVGIKNQTLTEHWDGSTWSIVSSPNIQSSNDYLLGVTAVSSENIWAVGYYHTNGSISQTLIEQWNGSSWSIVSSPNPGGTAYNDLYAVAGVSSNDIWAVGYYMDVNVHFLTLVEHWNGKKWSVVSSPNQRKATSNYLFGIGAISSSNIWAVGEYAVNNLTQNLIEDWNGKKWSIVPSANAGTADNILYGVAGDSSNDIWAVGFYDAGGQNFQTLTESYC